MKSRVHRWCWSGVVHGVSNDSSAGWRRDIVAVGAFRLDLPRLAASPRHLVLATREGETKAPPVHARRLPARRRSTWRSSIPSTRWRAWRLTRRFAGDPTHGYRTVAEARRHGLSCRFSMFYVRPNVNEILRDAFAEMFQSPFYVDQICSDYSAGGDSADSCDCDPGQDSADSCDCDPGRDCADSCDCDQVRSFTPVSEDIK